MSTAKPCLVLFAAYVPSRTAADELVGELATIEAVLDADDTSASAIHAGEDLDLPGVARMLGRFGLGGVLPE